MVKVQLESGPANGWSDCGTIAHLRRDAASSPTPEPLGGDVQPPRPLGGDASFTLALRGDEWPK